MEFKAENLFGNRKENRLGTPKVTGARKAIGRMTIGTPESTATGKEKEKTQKEKERTKERTGKPTVKV